MIDFAVAEKDLTSFLVLSVIALVGLGWSLIHLEGRHAARLRRFAQPETLKHLVTGHSDHAGRPMNVLVLLAMAFLLLALAGPQWGTDGSVPGRSSREILFLLDTSESMNAANPAPNRLDRARRKITELLLQNPADRFGLIAFSGGAALQCPLTTDHGYFKTILQAVDTDTLSAEGTDIESALREALAQFAGEDHQEDQAGRDDRIAILISDGEDVTGAAIEAAADLGNSSHVMVMGIGDPDGAEITLPQWMSRSKNIPKDAEPHWSRLDEEHLSDIAVAGDGVYVRSTLGDEDIRVVMRELAYLAGSAREGGPAVNRVNRYRWPLCIALVLIVLEGLWLIVVPRIFGRKDVAMVGEVIDDVR